MSADFDILKCKTIAMILTEFSQGNKADYQLLCNKVKNVAGLPDSEFMNLLANLRSCIGLLSTDTRELVSLILDVDLLNATEIVVKEYSQFVISLAVGQVAYTENVLRSLIKRFMPGLMLTINKSTEEIDKNFGDSLSKSYAAVHYMLSSITGISPMCQHKLLGILRDSYPFMRRHVVQLRDYVRNLLELAEYANAIKSEILRLIVDETLRLDTICTKEMSNLQMDREISSDIFHMDCDAEDLFLKNKAKLQELTEKLDIVLCDLFRYIKSHKQSSSALSSMYKIFLEIFERIVLPVFGCNHIQYLWFFICDLHEDICVHFLNWLWSKIRDPAGSSEVIRQTSACYLSALLARAKFVSLRQCKAFVLLWSNTLHKYMENDEGVSNRNHASKHALFYVLCQAMFYVIVARHKEFIDSPSGYQFLKNLRLDRLITCSLNPLKYCTDSVLYSFASISRSYQFAFCYGMIERNRRNALYDQFSFETSAKKTDHLNWFFPFEPYFLPKYADYVQNAFRTFSAEVQMISANKVEASKIENSSNDYEFLLPEDTLGRSLEKFYGGSLSRSPHFGSIFGKSPMMF